MGETRTFGGVIEAVSKEPKKLFGDVYSIGAKINTREKWVNFKGTKETLNGYLPQLEKGKVIEGTEVQNDKGYWTAIPGWKIRDPTDEEKKTAATKRKTEGRALSEEDKRDIHLQVCLKVAGMVNSGRDATATQIATYAKLLLSEMGWERKG